MDALSFDRFFTEPGTHPFNGINWEKRPSAIFGKDGEIIHQNNEVEVPESWSQNATDVAAHKYVRKAGVPTTGSEKSVQQLIFRVAHTIRAAGEKMGYFSSSEDAEIFEMELTFLLVHQFGAFNSPVWFNCGLSEVYGIVGSPGNWRVSEETGEAEEVDDSYRHPQNSACFIQSVDDDLMSIFELLQNEARLFKYGSGTGTNFSSLRGSMEKLSSGGVSSGLMSFLEVLDRGAGATKSGGTTRRAAKMVILDMDHPEIEEFIEWKVREEKKVAALIQAGYPADFNGEAYRTVSGQNSNNSVRVTDAFMDAYLRDGDWTTTLRTTGEPWKTLRARELMRKICEAAWTCADPGIQFDTTINDWHTCASTDRIRATNPCSEYVFLDDSACNLASLNLIKFLDEDGSFNVAAYRAAIRTFIIAQEILVGFSSYPTKKIAENSFNYRPLGLGFANLGALLMVKGMIYDSEEGRAFCGALTAILGGYAYQVSAEIASVKGPFFGFLKNREPMLRVIKKHRAAVFQLSVDLCPPELLHAAHEEWENAENLGAEFGFRNAQVTNIAPTGTIGLLMDCDTTGIEPDFGLVKFKKLAGGGNLVIINQSVPRALENLGYTESEVDEIVAYAIGRDGKSGAMTVEGAPHLKSEHLAVFDCANKCGENGTRFISPMGHVRMVAAAQPFLSGAISKTVNLPNEATVEDIERVYLEAWRLKVKAIAVYRDGSKLSQPLSARKTEKEKESAPQVKRHHLPDERPAITHKFSVGGHEGYITVGMYDDGKPGEVFLAMSKEGSTISGLMDTIATMTSIALQYGVPLEDLVRKFSHMRFEPQGFTGNQKIPMAKSLIDYLFRWLGLRFLPDTTEFTNTPPALGENGEIIHPAIVASKDGDSSLGREQGDQSDAPVCHSCGSLMRRTGSCYLCANCGANSGCS